MTITQEQLGEIGRKVFATRESTLEQEASGLDLNDVRSRLLEARREQRETLVSLPDQAFSTQQPGEGEEAWSAGQIVAHLANSFGSMTGFMRPILGLPEVAHTPHDLTQLPGRDEALAIHDATDAGLSELFSSIPSDADLSQTTTHPRFGELGPRGMLLLMLIHETNHLDQMRSLAGVS